MTKVVHLVAAARPNFMKVAPLYHALRTQEWARPILVHTGQHYDVNMSGAFLQDLGLPDPHIHLGIGSGSHAEQTGKVMIAYEKILLSEQPDMVVVVGDVNSTIACALSAAKIHYPARETDAPPSNGDLASDRRPIVAHLEAGLRSLDRSMPEEVNRIATDVLSDVLWTPSPDADENLIREGVDRSKIVRVGNIMIDSLEMLRERIEAQSVRAELGLQPRGYGVVTLHRPSNVDRAETLAALCGLLVRLSRRIPLVFPVHPRTRRNLEAAGLLESIETAPGITLLPPLSYVPFMSLIFDCRFVVTDSGGIQEETTYLGIPCLTLRPSTERPITITEGTNRLCGIDDVEQRLDEALAAGGSPRSAPALWDGRTAARVVESIRTTLQAI